MTNETPVETPEPKPSDFAGVQGVQPSDIEAAEALLEPSPTELNPPLHRCQFSMQISTYDIESLREGLDITALNIGRYGLGAFFVIATDPATGDQWVIQDGERIYTMAQWEASGEDEADDDPALSQAIETVVASMEEREDGRPD